MTLLRLALLVPLVLSTAAAEPLRVRVQPPAPPSSEGFHMGTATSPTGETIGINSRHLTKIGEPWMPVMGEFHYTRCPADEWREELLRVKAGGVDIVATYVFWNHHEAREGQWDWSGRRDLRRFIRLAQQAGLLAAVRLGPWCHGEARNGGVPDWALRKGWRLRSNDPNYLQHVRTIYGQVAQQLDGLLWKQGGPVMAVQVENEYRGRAEHLLKLKEIARQAGLDVPLYTRTGWPTLATPMPFGEIAPLYGAYAEGFWDRKLRSMPGKYWAAFRFQPVRTDAAIATEQLGERAARDEADAKRYPYLTCELGGGMVSSYHRRIRMQAADVEAVALAKIGSGGNLPGYYMYHGGVNPAGRLMERQDTEMTNYNDMPEWNYDFQAPVGAYGQTRPHYHALRRLHLMCRDFGHRLATMPAYFPEKMPRGSSDTSTLRWSVRSDGDAGFLFVNNHQRGATMPEHRGVQFQIDSPTGKLTLPAEPIRVAPGARFVWPFNLQLAPDYRLESATAQPICRVQQGERHTYFFAKTPGVPARFKFSDGVALSFAPGRKVVYQRDVAGIKLQIVLLKPDDSLHLWKGPVAGQERVVLTPADALFDDGGLSLRSQQPPHLSAAAMYPGVQPAVYAGGVFSLLPMSPVKAQEFDTHVTQVRQAGPPREISLGAQQVAAAPADADFASAAAWRIALPAGFDPRETDALLCIRYRGDVARVRIGDRVVLDDFYNGRVLELGLKRHAGLLQTDREITLEVLPLPADAPIYLEDKPAEGVLLSLDSVELVPRLHAGWTTN